MESESIIQGRLIGSEELESIQGLLVDNPDWSRTRISRSLCELWDWRAPNGQLKDMAARTLLRKLEQRGWLVLPARRGAPPHRMRHQERVPVDHATDPIDASLRDLMPLEIQELSQPSSMRSLWEWLLHRYHYLSYTGSVGLNLKYLICDRQQRPLSCLLFGSAAWQCAVRDQFIGWTDTTRQAHLQEITNNTRLLILPWVKVPHLASHLLSLVAGRVRQDWHRKYARPLRLIETFVDTSRFGGGCYGAARWIALGQTTGRTRQDRRHQTNAPPKAVWVYPLSQDFRQALNP
jgi:hypothetical protein